MDITTKFGQFKDRKLKSFDKDRAYDTLSDDITIISKLDNGNYEKVTEPVEIVQVFEKKVSCSGSTSEPNSSHPLVYLNIGDKPSISLFLL